MMGFISDDILDNECIINLVDCYGITSSLLFDRIRDTYPIVYDNYIHIIDRDKEYGQPSLGMSNLLGTTQIIKVEPFKHIINLFCMDEIGINLKYLERALQELKLRSKRFYHFEEVCIQIPKNNKDVYDLIMNLFRYDTDLTISIYKV